MFFGIFYILKQKNSPFFGIFDINPCFCVFLVFYVLMMRKIYVFSVFSVA